MTSSVAAPPSPREGPGMVRFGTFALSFDFEEYLWAELMQRRFRAMPAPHPGVDADMVLRIRRRPEARPASLEGDVIHVERDGDQAVVRCDMMTLDIDFAARPATADLTVHSGKAKEPEIEHCFAIFVHKLLQLCSVLRLHAAAIEMPAPANATHVFVGDKGAGKSTIALALGRAGGKVLGDDQLVVRRRNGGIVVSGCDGNIRLTERSERHFLDEPLAAPAQDFAGIWKKEVRLDGLVGAIPHRDRRAGRLYFPRVGDRFAVAPVPRREAAIRILDAIAPAYGFAGPADRLELLRLVLDFVTPLDCFDLELSGDLNELDRLVDYVTKASG